MVAVILVLALATYVRFYNVSAGRAGHRRPATAGLDHPFTLPPAWFEAGRTGEVITRLTADTTQIENVIGSCSSIALRNALLLVVAGWRCCPPPASSSAC